MSHSAETLHFLNQITLYTICNLSYYHGFLPPIFVGVIYIILAYPSMSFPIVAGISPDAQKALAELESSGSSSSERFWGGDDDNDVGEAVSVIIAQGLNDDPCVDGRARSNEASVISCDDGPNQQFRIAAKLIVTGTLVATLSALIILTIVLLQ